MTQVPGSPELDDDELDDDDDELETDDDELEPDDDEDDMELDEELDLVLQQQLAAYHWRPSGSGLPNGAQNLPHASMSGSLNGAAQ